MNLVLYITAAYLLVKLRVTRGRNRCSLQEYLPLKILEIDDTCRD